MLDRTTEVFSDLRVEIAVLIPCYNEELTIGKVVRDINGPRKKDSGLSAKAALN
ncbi:MAG: hypothetical protein ACYDHG_13845 [Desulfomonilaceae bacterium]